MTLVYSCIAPHGGEIIPELASKSMLPKFAETRKGMQTIAKRILQARPHTIVIASPHSLRLVGKIAVVVTENSTGDLKGSNKKTVSLAAKCDRPFAQKLLRESEREKLPVVGVNYGTASGPASDIRMDWGTLIPLWFVLNQQRSKSRIVIVTPSREIPIKENFLFGKVIGRLLEGDRTHRYVFVASADQAHAHSHSGPYGFSPAASKYDKLVQDLVRKNELRRIMRLDPRFVERAKPDSLWQMTLLAGVTDIVPSKSELISYQVPTYYGMLCAGYEPLTAP